MVTTRVTKSPTLTERAREVWPRCDGVWEVPCGGSCRSGCGWHIVTLTGPDRLECDCPASWRPTCVHRRAVALRLGWLLPCDRCGDGFLAVTELVWRVSEPGEPLEEAAAWLCDRCLGPEVASLERAGAAYRLVVIRARGGQR